MVSYLESYESELADLRRDLVATQSPGPDSSAPSDLAPHHAAHDVLLRAVATLTTSIRQTLDSEFDDLLQPLLGLLNPAALSPLPSAALVEFLPQEGVITQPFRLPKGSRVLAASPGGRQCTFTTIHELMILPWVIRDITLLSLGPTRQRLRLRLEKLQGAGPWPAEGAPLRFLLSGALRQRYRLYQSLFRHTSQVHAIWSCEKGRVICRTELGPESLSPIGLGKDERLLPPLGHYPTPGRLLLEHSVLPERFLGLEIGGLGDPRAGEAAVLQLDLDLSASRLDPDRVPSDSLRLNCVPVINIFPGQARPFNLRHGKCDYDLEPDVAIGHHLETYAVERVSSYQHATGRHCALLPNLMVSPAQRRQGEGHLTYTIRRDSGRPASIASSSLPALEAAHRMRISVNACDPALQTSPTTISADLLLTDGSLPSELTSDDLCLASSDIPPGLQVKALCSPTRAAPNLGPHSSLWQLATHIGTLSSWQLNKKWLCDLVELHHAGSRGGPGAAKRLQRMLDAIDSVHAQQERQLVGIPPCALLGSHLELCVHEKRLLDPAELEVFGLVLIHTLGELMPINTYMKLTIVLLDEGSQLQWAPFFGAHSFLSTPVSRRA